MCGEQPLELYWWSAHSGSSPRVRGAGSAPYLAHSAVGIIPACAGSRSTTTSRRSARRDHPRVCGEQCDLLCLVLALSGSSPRVRGAAIAYGCTRLHTRIIPACAGSRESF